jgi:2-hydroxymuconate-semialdehyde hydrolase
MRRIIQVMFVDPKWSSDEAYLDRRWEMALVPGAWEATSAARFKAPFRDASGKRERDNIDYGQIRVPTLVMAGKLDCLREPGYADTFVPQIPRASLHKFENAGHMGNIECAEEFNERVLSFLGEQKAVAA